jgi:hypothetical protein
VPTGEQIRLFEVALDIADQQDSLLNLLIEVHADGTVTAHHARLTPVL